MKVIIAGGRDYSPKRTHTQAVGELLRRLGATEVVSGGADGADLVGDLIAIGFGLPVTFFPAAWHNLHQPGAVIRTRNGRKYDARAGLRRNQQMADYADALIALPGGRGTADMMRRAEAKGIPVHKIGW